MSEQPTVADYIVQRLAREGITDCFGVAGDFAFKLCDAVARSEAIRWIGCSNELDAAYAADGYARVRGCSMLSTTYAVGELSALNGVMGAKAERSCVFHVVGMPTMRKQRVRQIVHHTLGDGEFQNFANISAQAACVSAVITPDNCVHEMERLIATARAESRPAYILVASDYAVTPVTGSAPTPYPKPASGPDLGKAMAAIAERIQAARSVAVLPAFTVSRFKLQDSLRALIETLGCPFAAMAMDKGILCETHPQFVGMYMGGGSSRAVLDAVERADLIIDAGGVSFNEINTAAYTSTIDPQKLVTIGVDHVRIGDQIYNPVRMGDVFEGLAGAVKKNFGYKAPPRKVPGKPGGKPDDPITAVNMYTRFRDFRNRSHPANLLYSQFVIVSMNQKFPIPEPLWNTIPTDAQAALLTAWKEMKDRIAALEAQVRDLQARLQLNSTNSSKPPSSDPIGLKRKPPSPPSRRKRGGQPGHRKAFRPLVPPEKLRSSQDCKPPACRRCGHALAGEDPNPLIHQVAELPKIEPIVDQYRLHRLACPDCGETTCGTLPAGVPTVSFGPYLQATLATLAGAYRLSKRQIQQLASDLFGLSISTGMISKLERQSAEALEAPYNELATAVHSAAVIGADETSWREDRHKAWLWAAVTAMFTVFTIARNRNAKVARAVLGTQDGSIAVTDRCSSYDWIAADFRQTCWGHLRRDFQAMIDRGGAAEPVGKKLLRLSDRLFRWWHRLEAKKVDWGRFQSAMVRLRREVKAALEEGARCDCPRTRGTCAEILRLEGSLWTFARVAGVPPTNNATERAERHAVIWRRISGGTDSAAGSRFVERMLTVVATCRQQGRNVLDYLRSCFEAARNGQAIPSLLPAEQPKVKVA